MRIADLLTLPIAALGQQKLRTMLTTLGVVFGAFVLAASLSIGEGVQETIDRESHRADIARRIEVYPRWNPTGPPSDADAVQVEGKMSDGRRERLRRDLAERSLALSRDRARTALSRERLGEIAGLPHVERMIPLVRNYGFAILGGKSEGAGVISARPDDESRGQRVVAGRYFNAEDERGVIVSEFLAYRLGVKDDEDIEHLIGTPLRLEFREAAPESGFVIYLMKPNEAVSREERIALDKVTARLPDALGELGLAEAEAEALHKAMRAEPAAKPLAYAEEYPVVGVIRRPTDRELEGPWDPLNADFDVLLPGRTAMDLYFRGPGRAKDGVDRAVLLADSEENVKDIVKLVAEAGLDARASVEFIERERLIYLLIFGAMTCVAGVALLVSAVGIANTMLMSVLERTREIGIMKAIGADNRHLLFIFLIEGALIGLLGSLIGLLLAWAASYPGDAWVRSVVLRDMKLDLKESIFAFHPWMAMTVLLFTTLVTTLAAVYPARHAARIDPVTALRHE